MNPRGLSPTLALLLLLTACGGGGASQPDTAPVGSAGVSSRPVASAPASAMASIDTGSEAGAGDVGTACELLSDADIAEVTTFVVNTVRADSAGGIFENGCWWTLADSSSSGPEDVEGEIILGVLESGGRAHYDTYYAPYAFDAGAVPLEGVGDEGLMEAGGGAVTALKGDVLVNVNWIALSGDPAAVSVPLMERVLSNLAGD